MIKTKFTLIFTLILVSLLGNAQETTSNFDEMRKNSISFNFFGTTPLIGITYDRVVSENISLEVGVGLPSVGAGVKYYPWGIKESEIMLHVGLTGTYLHTEAFNVYGNDDKNGIFIVYIPVGVSYFGEHGFNLGIDIGPGVATETEFYFNLKLGYRF